MMTFRFCRMGKCGREPYRAVRRIDCFDVVATFGCKRACWCNKFFKNKKGKNNWIWIRSRSWFCLSLMLVLCMSLAGLPRSPYDKPEFVNITPSRTGFPGSLWLVIPLLSPLLSLEDCWHSTRLPPKEIQIPIPLGPDGSYEPTRWMEALQNWLLLSVSPFPRSRIPPRWLTPLLLGNRVCNLRW